VAKLVVGFVELSSSQPNASLAVGGDGANPLENFPQLSFFLLPYNQPPIATLSRVESFVLASLASSHKDLLAGEFGR